MVGHWTFATLHWPLVGHTLTPRRSSRAHDVTEARLAQCMKTVASRLSFDVGCRGRPTFNVKGLPLDEGSQRKSYQAYFEIVKP